MTSHEMSERGYVMGFERSMENDISLEGFACEWLYFRKMGISKQSNLQGWLKHPPPILVVAEYVLGVPKTRHCLCNNFYLKAVTAKTTSRIQANTNPTRQMCGMVMF